MDETLQGEIFVGFQAHETHRVEKTVLTITKTITYFYSEAAAQEILEENQSPLSSAGNPTGKYEKKINEAIPPGTSKKILTEKETTKPPNYNEHILDPL